MGQGFLAAHLACLGFRFGRRIDRTQGLAKHLLTMVYGLLFNVIGTLVGVNPPKSVRLGPGLRIWHFGGIVVHPDVVIGANCTLRQGVTIGNRDENGPVPVIGSNVDFGAYAQVLGGVRIGNDCRIGAMAVVLEDMPEGATAIGVPARIIVRRTNRT